MHLSLLGPTTVLVFFLLQSSLTLFRLSSTVHLISSMSPAAISLNLIFIYGALYVIFILTQWAEMATVLGILSAILYSLFNFHKLAITGTALVLGDFWEWNQFRLIKNYVSFYDLLTLLCVLPFLYLILSRKRRNLSSVRSQKKIQSAGFVLAYLLFILLIVFNRDLKLDPPLKKVGIEQLFWDPTWNHRINGVAIGTLLSLSNDFISTPPNYNRTQILKILPPSPQDPISTTHLGKKPHVLLYMMEALWDPLWLPVHWNQDPIPTFHRLQKEGTAGALIVPAFGGQTANIEFEILTGLSTYFQPPGTIAYVQYLKNPTESLASLFRQEGYFPIAFHNYNDQFYHRYQAYPLLGFERFESIQNMTPDWSQTQGYPKDEVLIESILRMISQAQTPLFIHAVTMQSHGPYFRIPPHPPLQLTQSTLNKDLSQQLQAYGNVIWEADQALNHLTQSLRAINEDVILIAFGDHLPSLGNQFGAYVSSGWISQPDPSQWSAQEWEKMHTTPLVIWHNHSSPNSVLWRNSSAQAIPRLSTHCLGNEILKLTQIPFDSFHRFLETLCSQFPILNPSLFGDHPWNYLRIETSRPDQELPAVLQDYQLLNYDRLWGKGYSEGNRNDH